MHATAWWHVGRLVVVLQKTLASTKVLSCSSAQTDVALCSGPAAIATHVADSRRRRRHATTAAPPPPYGPGRDFARSISAFSSSFVHSASADPAVLCLCVMFRNPIQVGGRQGNTKPGAI